MKLLEEKVLFGAGPETHGLGVVQKTYEGGATVEQYTLPEMAMIAGFTCGGEVIVVQRNHPALGRSRQLPSMTFKPEDSRNRLRAAAREFSSMTGYRPGKIRLITRLLENTGRSERTCRHYVATACTPIEGFEQERRDILGVVLLDPLEFRGQHRKGFRRSRGRPHRVLNTFVVLELALEELGLIK